MIQFTDMTGLASSAIAVAAMAARLPGRGRIPKSFRIALPVIVAGAALVPFDSLPLAAYLRGVIGDLSISTLTLLVLLLHSSCMVPTRPVGEEDSGGRHMLHFLIASAAMVFYPLALGAGLYDPYRWGFGNPWFIGVLLVMALFAYFLGKWLVALIITLAGLAWVGDWYESTNLWDYLLDPFVAIYATAALLKQGLRLLRRR
jgi:hypothetical protein